MKRFPKTEDEVTEGGKRMLGCEIWKGENW